MKKFLTILIAVFLAILPFSACSNPTENTDKVKIRLNEVTHSIFYAPMYLAIELGYFDDENIELELTNGGGADNCMTALLSGNADIILAGPEASIYVINGGRQDAPVVFAQLTKRDGSFLVSRKAEPDFKWSNLENKTVIAGRRGGVPAMTFEYVCKKNNLIDGTNITLNMDVQFNLMGPSFEGGTGDYVTLFEPTASEYQKAGKGFIVASVGEESGEVPYTAFAAKKSFIDKNRDTVVKFTTALQRAVKFILEKTDAEVAEKLVGKFPDTAMSSIEASVKSYKKIDAWMTNFSMTVDALNRLQTIMTDAGELDKSVKLTDLVDNSIAEEVYNSVMK